MSIIENENDSIFEKPWSKCDFKFGKPLGKGRFGHVFVAKEIRTKYQHLVAIKILLINSLEINETTENFRRECQLHLTLKHPNVIGFYGWFYDDDRIYFILEYAPQGNLFQKIEKGPLSENLSATYAYQTAKGLHYIHSKNVIHRDLKPENLLIGNFGEIKIADFGWANKVIDVDLGNSTVCKSLAGTIDYLCPEIIAKTGHGKKVDIWCLGVLCYEMLVGSPPFYDDSTNRIIDNILKVKFKCPDCVSPKARNLIGKLLVKNPSSRIELEDVLRDDWIVSCANKDEKYMEFYVY